MWICVTLRRKLSILAILLSYFLSDLIVQDQGWENQDSGRPIGFCVNRVGRNLTRICNRIEWVFYVCEYFFFKFLNRIRSGWAKFNSIGLKASFETNRNPNFQDWIRLGQMSTYNHILNTLDLFFFFYFLNGCYQFWFEATEDNYAMQEFFAKCSPC